MYLPKRLENTCPQKNLQTSVHCSFLHYRPKAETTHSPPAGGGKGNGGVFVQQSTTVPKKRKSCQCPGQWDGVSLHAMGKEADEYIPCTLTEILAVVVFKTVSLQDQASLDLM